MSLSVGVLWGWYELIYVKYLEQPQLGGGRTWLTQRFMAHEQGGFLHRECRAIRVDASWRQWGGRCRPPGNWPGQKKGRGRAPGRRRDVSGKALMGHAAGLGVAWGCGERNTLGFMALETVGAEGLHFGELCVPCLGSHRGGGGKSGFQTQVTLALESLFFVLHKSISWDHESSHQRPSAEHLKSLLPPGGECALNRQQQRI